MHELTIFSDQLKKLCNSYKVKSLFAFGSILTANYNKQNDIDLIVDIAGIDPLEYSDNYFNLKFGLEDLLNRNIDLLEDKAIKNPYLRERIEKTKVLVYGI